MMLASSWPIIAISGGGRPCTGTRRLRDTVRVPFVYVRRMRSVSIFESHVSAIRPDHALAVRQHEGNPRAQTRVALRVQGGPLARRVSAPRPCPHPAEHRSRRCVAARTPGAAVHPHRRLPRPDALLRRRGHRARLPRARLRATGTRGGHRCCPGRPHTRQSASRRRAETTCWNTPALAARSGQHPRGALDKQ